MKKLFYLFFIGYWLFPAASAMKTRDVGQEEKQQEQQMIDQIQHLLQQKQWQQAFPLMEKIAQAGNLQAQANLGLMYQSGQGTEKNAEKAYWWFSEAAEKGSIKAINNLALMYLNGHYVKKDLPQAIKLLEKTADAKNQDAVLLLGHIYFNQQHDKKAFTWFKKAMELGNVEGKFRLGLLYEQGRGTAKNQAKAMKLYREILAENPDEKLKNQTLERLAGLENRTQDKRLQK